MYWKIVTAIGLSTALLGCSSEAPTIASMRKVPPPSEQLEQLASTISGATYLKNYCNRSDLGRTKISLTPWSALPSARGWDMAHLDQSQLSERREVFYGNLVSNRDITENCNQLNRALAGILHSVYPR